MIRKDVQIYQYNSINLIKTLLWAIKVIKKIYFGIIKYSDTPTEL